MDKDKITLKVECGACRATGIYSGLAEPIGTGVVCLNCGGTGSKELTFKLFKDRKKRDDIKTVMVSRGSFLLNCGPVGTEITYEEFLKGKMPVAS